MREQMQLRLEELKKEFEFGQHRLQETERQQALLRETLLRISGAIQVLEEALANGERRQDDHQFTDGGQDGDALSQSYAPST
jgi:predicted nuclease with TOPRIM domain